MANDRVAALKDIGMRETLVLALIAIAVLFIGLYPLPLTEVLNLSVSRVLEYAAVSKL